MAITITQDGSEIVTEKLNLIAVSDVPAVTSVIMQVYVNVASPSKVKITHLPVFGTTDTFVFEVNSIIKDYFASEFLPLTGVNQTSTENVLAGFAFQEMIGDVVQPGGYFYNALIKNITQDTFEIEEFDLADYDCGDTGSTSSKLLTSAPNPLPVGDLTSVHVSCLGASYDGSLNPKQEWVIETFLNGVLVVSNQEPVDVPSKSLVPFAPLGKYDVSNYRFDFNSADGYDEVRFYIRDIASPFTSRSETRSYKLNDACEKSITLSWLNELGAQDTFTFLGNIVRNGKYTDSTYKRVRPVNPVSTDVGDLVYKSSYNYQYDIFSDRMPENAVQWLSNILINKRAAIQIEAVYTSTDVTAYLYNAFSLNNGVRGDGRAVGGIVNTSLASWVVPSSADSTTLTTFLGGLASAGGAMKEAGLTNWDAPNTGATNSSGFTALGSGVRAQTGAFQAPKSWVYYWYSDAGVGGVTLAFLNLGSAAVFEQVGDDKIGASVRLMRPALGGEVNGQVVLNAYTGNNGKTYDGIVIGTQVWISKDLQETIYNNGIPIANVTGDAAWGLLSTGAYCLYDNLAIINTTKVSDSKYFPIAITTEETVLEDKFTPETLFRLKFRLANRRKGLK